MFAAKLPTTRGEWKDKTEFFIAQFKDIVPSASLQANMAIADLEDVNSFTFSDI
jgi:hypothetical protein